MRRQDRRAPAFRPGHKAAYDGDQGPNTGGMGAYSPAPILPYNEAEAMADTVIRPILPRWPRTAIPSWACSMPV